MTLTVYCIFDEKNKRILAIENIILSFLSRADAADHIKFELDRLKGEKGGAPVMRIKEMVLADAIGGATA